MAGAALLNAYGQISDVFPSLLAMKCVCALTLNSRFKNTAMCDFCPE